MKFHRITRCAFAGIGLAFSGGLLLAREPVRDLAALAKLESKVEAVSSKVMPATVALLSEKTGSSGSGVITTADGLVLTAAHVVQGAEELTVVFPDGEQVAGKVLGANYSKDIAMVQISAKGPWPFAEMGASKPLEAGDWVVALGHSAGFDAARTPPVRFGRVVSKGPGNFLTTDCTLIGGDSGGPLFDLTGKLIGIHSRVGMRTQENMHVPVREFVKNWEGMLKSEFIGEGPFAKKPEKGKGFLGIGTAPRAEGGLKIDKVGRESPAEKAGLKEGDVILKLDGVELTTKEQFQDLLKEKAPEDRVALELLRDGKPETLTLRLGER